MTVVSLAVSETLEGIQFLVSDYHGKAALS
jgi:hypothetical protein